MRRSCSRASESATSCSAASLPTSRSYAIRPGMRSCCVPADPLERAAGAEPGAGCRRGRERDPHGDPGLEHRVRRRAAAERARQARRHAGGANKDVSVVGDVTRRMAASAGTKPVWTTLQIAWSGVTKPGAVPRFPTLQEERFMAYQAVVAGARGLAFFGGHLAQVMRPADARAGWNWTFWAEVLQPLLAELSSTAVAPALVAPAAK